MAGESGDRLGDVTAMLPAGSRQLGQKLGLNHVKGHWGLGNENVENEWPFLLTLIASS
jgi:hypothetical protein